MSINKDSIKAAKFLRLIRKTGYINIVAIHPVTTEILGLTRPITSPDIDAFIAKHNGTSNLYFAVNEPHPTAPDNKLKKQHIKLIHGLYIDIDPDKHKDLKEERARIRLLMNNLNTSPNPPSYIIDSGGGSQAFWLLDTPLPAEYAEQAESHGRGLAHLHDADAIQNIDRVMRIPYTINLPNKLKKEHGRVETLATLTHATQKLYNKDTIFTLSHPVQAHQYDEMTEDFDFSSLQKEWPIELRMRWDDLLTRDEKLQALLDKRIEKPSRSEYDFAVMQRLKMANWSIEDASQAVYLFPWGKGTESTQRELVRAYNRAENPFMQMSLCADVVEAIMKQPHPTLTIAVTQKVERKRKYRFAGKTSWKRSYKPLFKKLINQGSLVAVYGQSNIGKSFVTLDMAGHIAIGRDWAGFKLKERGSVLVVAGEAGGTYDARTSALKRRLGLPEDIGEREFPLVIYDDYIDLLGDPKVHGICEGVLELIAQQGFLREDTGLECKLIVVDTLSSVFGGGNENSSEDMGRFVSNMLQLVKMTGCTVVIVHHSGKDQSAGLRGHSKLIGGIDTSLEVRMSVVGGRERREIVSKKQRDTKIGDAIEFNLNYVELGLDDDGDIIDSCNILLKTDSEFESVIPDKLEQLTEGQLAMYNAIFVCDKLNTRNILNVNGYYKYFSDNPNLSVFDVLQGVETGCRQSPCTGASFGSKRSILYKHCLRLEELGLVEKDDKDQWVIV